jgi:hypothetical protein
VGGRLKEKCALAGKITTWKGMGSCSSKRILLIPLCFATLVVVSLACSLPSERMVDSFEATQKALDVEATTLALEKARLTQQAGSQAAPPGTATNTSEPEAEDTATPTLETTEDTTGAVEGSLVRAAFDPAYGWGDGHDRDHFDDAAGLFPSNSAGAANAWYGGGRYNITFTSRGLWTWYWSSVDAEDFYVEVVISNGDQCVSGDSAGMVFRGDTVDDRGLMFGISCGGEYFIGKTYWPPTDSPVCTWRGGWSLDCDQREMIPSALIQSGPGAINRLGIKAEGLDVNFYINGVWVDNRMIPSGWFESSHGQFALYLGTAQKLNASVSFDDFAVWYLD